MRKYFLIFLFVGILFSAFDETPEGASGSNQEASSTASSPKAAKTPSKTSNTTAAREHLYVTGDRVNQRVAPNTSKQVLGQLKRGDKVRLVSVEGRWTEVVSSLGRGWMHSDYLSKEEPPRRSQVTQQKKRTVAVPSQREIANAKREIIRQSIRSYPGSCPCPYNLDRAGRRCGGRSAWSKPGGYSPVCYESDVSKARLSSYFARKIGATN